MSVFDVLGFSFMFILTLFLFVAFLALLEALIFDGELISEIRRKSKRWVKGDRHD